MTITRIGNTYSSNVYEGEGTKNISERKFMDRINDGEKINLFQERPNGVLIELSEEGIRKLNEETLSIKQNEEANPVGSYEERVKLLQEALEPAQELYRIVPGSDLRSKYGYISTGELMKENDPEAYDKYSKMLTEAFEKKDKDLLMQATKDMLDWLSDFEKDSPLFTNYVKFSERI